MSSIKSNAKEFDEKIQFLAKENDGYKKVEEYLEDYISTIEVEDVDMLAYTYAYETFEKSKKVFNKEASDIVCEKVIKFGKIQTDEFIKSFAPDRNRLDEITEQEIKAFLYIKHNQTKDFIDLIENDPNIRIESKYGNRTLLIHALEFERLDLFKYLISKQANKSAVDSYGRDCIKIACLRFNNNLILDFLIQNGFLEYNNNKSLEIILTNGDLNQLDLNGTDSFGATTLHYIAALGKLEILKKIETKISKFDIKDKTGLTCFDRAALNGHLETLKHLLKISITKYEYSNEIFKGIIKKALMSCRLNVIEWWFDNVKSIPGDVISKGDLLDNMIIDSFERAKDVMNFFLKSTKFKQKNVSNLQINERDSYGNTILMLLAGQWTVNLTVEFVKFLIEQGVDINAKNNEKQNFAHKVVQSGNCDLLQYLYGISPLALENVDEKGNTLLIVASENGFIDIVKFLMRIEFSNDLMNKKNTYGLNALDVAFYKGYYEIANILKEKNLELNLPRLISKIDYFKLIAWNKLFLQPGIFTNVKIECGSINILRGQDRGREAWHYADIYPWFIEKFNNLDGTSTLDVSNHGKILKSGWGKDPSDEVRSELAFLINKNILFEEIKESIAKSSLEMIEKYELYKYKDCYGANFLHLCAAYGRADVIIWLFLNKYNLNDTDNYGNTAQYYAAMNNQYETVILLKLLGLNRLFNSDCKFLSGHIDNYSIYSKNEYFPKTLISQILNAFKVFNSQNIPTKYLEQADRILNKRLIPTDCMIEVHLLEAF